VGLENTRTHTQKDALACTHSFRLCTKQWHHSSHVHLIAQVDAFALDLEHHAKRSYLGVTCLIQISTGVAVLLHLGRQSGQKHALCARMYATDLVGKTICPHRASLLS